MSRCKNKLSLTNRAIDFADDHINNGSVNWSIKISERIFAGIRFGGKLHSGEIRWESKERALSTHSRCYRPSEEEAEPSWLEQNRARPNCGYREASLSASRPFVGPGSGSCCWSVFRVTVRCDHVRTRIRGPLASTKLGRQIHTISKREDRNSADLDCVYISRRNTEIWHPCVTHSWV